MYRPTLKSHRVAPLIIFFTWFTVHMIDFLAFFHLLDSDAGGLLIVTSLIEVVPSYSLMMILLRFILIFLFTNGKLLHLSAVD